VIEPRYLLDTNICIYLFGASSLPVRDKVSDCLEGELAISAIVLAELVIGIEKHDNKALEMLETLLAIASVLPFDEAAARAYGELPFKRAKFDRLIAAHAMSRGLTLVTANPKDFTDLADLTVEDWTTA
jgi:tRNA(fMet)-specific endonuclease VapC